MTILSEKGIERNIDDSREYMNKGLKEIEAEIREELKYCDYWGELKISRAEYEYLCDALRNRRGDKSVPEFIDYLYREYPACTVTTMVFFIVFEYRNNDFWDPWNNKIGIQASQNHTSREGNEMLEVLDRFDMNKYEDDGYKFISPLICQAGVPDSNLDDIFYAVTTTERFDAHEMIAEFKGWRAFYIKKPLERFIRLHEEKALNLIVQVHDVILGEGIETEDSYEGRVFSQYAEWKEENLNKRGVFKGKGAYQENPSLIFDEDKGLCVVLPEFIMEDEYCDYIKWVIEDGDNALFCLECEILNDGNSKHSLKKTVPVAARKEYEIKVYEPDDLNGDKLLEDWSLAGLEDQGYMLFGDNGRYRKDDLFTYEGGTVIVSDSITNIQFNDVVEDEIFFPNDDGINIFHFVPEKSTASIRLGENSEIEINLKRNLRVNLREGSYLFGSGESGFNYPIYTSEPMVVIEKEDGELDVSISMVLRNRDTGVKRTVAINQIDLLNDDDEYVSFWAMKTFGVNNDEYGRYSIKFYVRGLYKREIDFAYLPEIIYDDNSQELWPNDKGTFLPSGFKYKNPKEASIEFTSRVNTVTEKDDKGYWHLVKTREPNEFIEGNVTVSVEDKTITIPFRKRIRNVQWRLWKESDIETELSYGEGRLDIKEMQNDNWLLSFSMRKPTDEEESWLQLKSKEDKLIQRIKITPSAKGKWHMSLRAFEASINDNRLPLTVSFVCSSGNCSHEFRIIEIYESIILNDLKITQFKRRVDEEKSVLVQVLTWKPVPSDYDISNLCIKSLTNFDMDDIQINNVRKKTTKDGKKIQYMAFDHDLPPGLYKLAYGEEDFFDFGYDEFEPPVLTHDNTFVVGQKSLLASFNEGNLRGIIDALSVAYKKEDMLKKMIQISSEKAYGGELEVNDYRRMIVFAIYALKAPEGRCEKRILEILRIVCEKLEESAKSHLFDTIVEVEIKEADKKKLIDFYNLYYVIVNEAPQETVDKIMSIDTFLGTRSIMKCPRKRWVLNSLTASLGTDIIKEMTRKTEDGSIHVEATYDMFGDAGYFYNMFDWESILKAKNYKMPKLDLSKKPDDELIFWSDGFISLMIKWYFKRQGKHAEREKETETERIAVDINRLAMSIKKTSDKDVQDYFDKTIGREPENCNGFYTLIAYSVKAGMIYALHDFKIIELNETQRELLFNFINNMTEIFPELIKRDILMAELFLYLKEV